MSTSGTAVADMLPQTLYEHIYQKPPKICEKNISPTFDALNEGGSPRTIGFMFGTGKLEWLGYNLVKFA